MSDDEPLTADHDAPTPTAAVEGSLPTGVYDGHTPGQLLAGRYRLLEPVGEGGMGTVWKAEQTEPVRRLVAVKLIKSGADTKTVLARFDAERQALALMDHPNIAKVLDAGVADDGRPFFVMELVRGVPITRHCDAKQLSVRDRLALFIPVCQAIQHAHQKGVIHRDIKPTNVLVAEYDGKPVPKVIDFGVAKATGGRLTDSTLETNYGAVVGTPEYMSPEQAADSADIDTRSDVYALGVLLYELLTGSPPHDRAKLRAVGLLEVLRIVREEEPPPPSSRLTDVRVPNVQELDWIVMKALEKDRTRRYDTATSLAADVQRHLSNEPVSAGPPGAGYRMRKFVRRHRGPVVAAAAVLLALVGGMIGTVWGLVEARTQRDAADVARAAAVDDQRLAREAQAEEKRQRGAAEVQRILADANRVRANSATNIAELAKVLADKERASALIERGKAIQAAVRADGLRLGAESTTALRTDPGLALLLALEGVKRHPHHLTFAALYAAAAELREENTIYGVRGPLAVLPNGKGFACANQSKPDLDRSKNRAVTLFDAAGKPGVSWPGYGMDVTALAVSPDGKRVATTLSGSTVGELGGPGGEAERVVYTSRVVYVWDAATGKDVFHLRGHTDGVVSVEFSPDGKRILTGSCDGTARLWDAATGELVRTLKAHECSLTLARFSPDGSKVLTIPSGSWATDDSWSAWKDANDKPRFDPGPTDRPVRLFPGGPKRTASVTAGDGFAGRVWDAATGDPVAGLKRARSAKKLLHNWTVTQGRFSPDGKLVALTFTDDVAGLWDATAGGTERVLKPGFRGEVSDIAFSQDGKRYAVAGNGGVLLASTPGNDESEGWSSGSLKTTAVRYNRIGRRLLYTDSNCIYVADDDSPGGVFDPMADTSGPAEVKLLGHGGAVQYADFVHDGRQIVSVAADGTARLWSVAPPPEVAQIVSVGDKPVAAFAVSPDGTRLAVAVAGDEATVRVLDVATGKQVCEIGKDKVLGEIRSVGWNSEGTQVVTASAVTAGYKNGKQVNFSAVYVWDAATGEDLYSFPEHQWGARHAAFLPDGKRIVTISDGATRSVGGAISGGRSGSENDGIVRVWDAATRKLAYILEERMTEPSGLAASRDGRFLMAVAAGHGLTAYAPATGKVIWRAQTSTLGHVVISPDAERLVTWGRHGLGQLRRAADGRVVANLPPRAAVSPVAFAPDGKQYAVPTGTTVGVFTADAGTAGPVLIGHESDIRGVSFSPDGTRVLTFADDNTAAVWDRATGKLQVVYRSPAAIKFAAFVAGGVATAGDDGAVRLWPADPAATLAKRVPRELTPAERVRYDLPAK